MKRSSNFVPRWSKPKDGLYWRAWTAAKAVLMAGRETWTKAEEEAERHALHVKALGEDKSHVDFTNDDFDDFLGACKAITEPDNLQAQLDFLEGRKKRLLFGIARAAAPEYVAGIVERMSREGNLSASRLDMLDPDDLQKVRVALTQDARRHAPGWEGVIEKREAKRAAARARELVTAEVEPDPF